MTPEAERILAIMEAQERIDCRAWVDGCYALFAECPPLVKLVMQVQIQEQRERPWRLKTPAEFGALVRGLLGSPVEELMPDPGQRWGTKRRIECVLDRTVGPGPGGGPAYFWRGEDGTCGWVDAAPPGPCGAWEEAS